MEKSLYLLFPGMLLGTIREILVIKYQDAVIRRTPFIGALMTAFIGLADFAIIFSLIKLENPLVFIGYISGETASAFLGIRYLRKK